MVIKETCESVRAVEVLLEKGMHVSIVVQNLKKNDFHHSGLLFLPTQKLTDKS